MTLWIADCKIQFSWTWPTLGSTKSVSFDYILLWIWYIHMIYSFIRTSNGSKKVLQVLRIQRTELLNFSFSSKQIGHSFSALITLYSWIWQYFVYMHIYTFYFETNKSGIYYSYTGKRFATGGCSLPFLQADEKFTELFYRLSFGVCWWNRDSNSKIISMCGTMLRAVNISPNKTEQCWLAANQCAQFKCQK